MGDYTELGVGVEGTSCSCDAECSLLLGLYFPPELPPFLAFIKQKKKSMKMPKPSMQDDTMTMVRLSPLKKQLVPGICHALVTLPDRQEAGADWLNAPLTSPP